MVTSPAPASLRFSSEFTRVSKYVPSLVGGSPGTKHTYHKLSTYVLVIQNNENLQWNEKYAPGEVK